MPAVGAAGGPGGVDELYVERHDLVVESSRVDSGDGAAVALQRERVLRLARDADSRA